ncbi:GNAT family N-acetyltransferase [Stenoxybacter acetivorans]|uniref:GNAT family N-acetyltransferase n=1 Tax=Stenoxybacter acetivorans TaxID=422441 RepID=UPI00055A2A1A|nr:GNAT family N-acyltransferase [Stenoxybacter acetivorans]
MQPLYFANSRFSVSLAQTAAEIDEAQALRYQVFAEEMGANIVSDCQRDVDHYDSFCRHLVVRENEHNRVVGCYRLLDAASAQKAGGWYSESEFDLSRLQPILPKTVELGRACVHPDFRDGAVIAMLWAGLAKFMQQNGLDYMIGCGSICVDDGGCQAAAVFRQLQALHYAPEEYRVFPKKPLPSFDENQAHEAELPALLKGYLRAGAYVCGEPHLDEDFQCADVLVMMPLAQMNPRYARHFLK